jgi:hypothetical protein
LKEELQVGFSGIISLENRPFFIGRTIPKAHSDRVAASMLLAKRKRMQ